MKNGIEMLVEHIAKVLGYDPRADLSSIEVPCSEPIPSEAMPYSKFRKMKHLGPEKTIGMSPDELEFRCFAEQARYMADFEDDYRWDAPSPAQESRYIYFYNDMDMSMLRRYFTWRTHYRQGKAVSFVSGFIHVYFRELFLGIGYDDPEDGLNRILRLFKFYAEETRIRASSYESQYIYNEGYLYAYEFAAFNSITSDGETWLKKAGWSQEMLPLLAVFNTWQGENTFEWARKLSEYDPYAKTAFFTTQELHMVNELCYIQVMNRLGEEFRKNGINPDYLIYGKPKKDAQPYIYGEYRLPPDLVLKDGSDREYVANPQIRIIVKKGKITEYRPSSAYNAVGSVLLAYIFKRIEAKMRIRYKHKYKLRPSRESLVKKLRALPFRMKAFYTYAESDRMDQVIDDTVLETCAAFDEAQQTVHITVNKENLKRIRQEAEITQERLTVEEAEELQTVYAPAAEKPVISPAPAPEESGDEWQRWISRLNDSQIRLVRAIAGDTPVTDALACGQMAGPMLEEINDLAMDETGDAVIDESADPPVIFEDYLENIQRVLAENP